MPSSNVVPVGEPLPPPPPSHPPPRALLLDQAARGGGRGGGGTRDLFDVTYRHRALGLDLGFKDGRCLVVRSGGGARRGDAVVKVNGTRLNVDDEMTFRDAILSLQAAARPVRLTFERGSSGRAMPNEAAAAAAPEGGAGAAAAGGGGAAAAFYEVSCAGMGCRGTGLTRGVLVLELSNGRQVALGVRGEVVVGGKASIVVDSVEGAFGDTMVTPRRGDCVVAIAGVAVAPALDGEVRGPLSSAQRKWVDSGQPLKIALARPTRRGGPFAVYTVALPAAEAAGIWGLSLTSHDEGLRVSATQHSSRSAGVSKGSHVVALEGTLETLAFSHAEFVDAAVAAGQRRGHTLGVHVAVTFAEAAVGPALKSQSRRPPPYLAPPPPPASLASVLSSPPPGRAPSAASPTMRRQSADRESWQRFSPDERRCLAQLRRVLRACVGAELYEATRPDRQASTNGRGGTAAVSWARRQSIIARPKMVGLRELGDFDGVIINPLLGRPMKIRWAEVARCEMPMPSTFGVDDGTLAASFLIVTKAGASYALATDSGALAYLLADGIELARLSYLVSDRPLSTTIRVPPPRPAADAAGEGDPAGMMISRPGADGGGGVKTMTDEDRPRSWTVVPRMPSVFEMNESAQATSFWRTLRRGLVVELSCAEATYSIKVGKRHLGGARELFRHGEYVRATVVRRTRQQEPRGGRGGTKHRYTLRYRDGPFDEGTGRKTRHKLPKGTLFVGVPRDCIVVKYEDQSRYWPFALLLVGAAQVATFLYFARRKPGNTTLTGPVVGPQTLWYWIMGPFPDCRDGRRQAWRLVSYQLAHSGYYHLFSNVILQTVYGVSVEAVHGHLKLLLIYQLGVAIGALTCAFSDIHRAVIGASGGLYTLIGLHTADVLVNFNSMGNVFKALARLLVCIVVPATDLVVYLLLVHDSGGMSYSAHIGGWIAGLFLGVAALTPITNRPSHSLLVRPLATILLVLYAGFALAWWATHFPPKYFINGPPWRKSSYSSHDSDPNCCWQLRECDDLDADQYNLFNCNDSRDLVWPYEGFDESKIETCSQLVNFANCLLPADQCGLLFRFAS